MRGLKALWHLALNRREEREPRGDRQPLESSDKIRDSKEKTISLRDAEPPTHTLQ